MPGGDRRLYKLTDLFTHDELNLAMKLFIECKKTKEDFTARCARERVGPVISRINKHTGYDNNPEYLAYCLEISIRSVGREEGTTRH